jgi:heme/copper-type cytochrome/quinol oxidase subunit 2
MKNNTSSVLVAIVIIVVILLVGIFLYYQGNSSKNTQVNNYYPSANQDEVIDTPVANPTTSGTQIPTVAIFTGKDSFKNIVMGDGPIPDIIANAQVFKMSIKNFTYVDSSTGKTLQGNLPATSEVVWTNTDSMAHTVTFDNGMADSGPIQPGKTFAFYFTKPGTYTYHCTIHPNMKGSITLR